MVLLFTLGSCNQQDAVQNVTLPVTPVLSAQLGWALVDFPNLRVRIAPDPEAEQVTRLARGTLVEVLLASPREQVLEGRRGNWYQIQYQGRRGWVFGPYLVIFNSLEEARAALENWE